MSQKKNMLIRAIPLDIWERIDRFCRRRGMKRRDFLELALRSLEGDDAEKDQMRAEEEVRAAMARVSQIKEEIGAYEEAIKLKKRIGSVYKDIEIIGEEKTQMNTILELRKLMIDLNEIIEKYVPKHEIPDDPEVRRQMGFPERYCEHPFFRSMSLAEAKKIAADIDLSDPSCNPHPAIRKLREEMDRKQGLYGYAKRAKEDAVTKEEPVSVKSEEDRADLKERIAEMRKKWEEIDKKREKDSSKKERSNGKKGKGISTEFFSRGFEDLDEEE